MSDFSELCPLFHSGVFHEITFPQINMTGVTATVNALVGTLVHTAIQGLFKFGRTVVVTGAFVKRLTVQVSEGIVVLNHHKSELTAGTEFGSLSIETTLSAMEQFGWIPMNVTAKTFTSSEILGISMATGTTDGPGEYDFIIRYKEK